MPFSGIFEVDLTPIYVDLGNTLGAYVVEPGEIPFIVLHESLKDKQDPTAQIVYQALVAFHKALPDVYRLFPLTQYFENLPEPAVKVKVGIDYNCKILPFRPVRRWAYNLPSGEGFHVVGK